MPETSLDRVVDGPLAAAALAASPRTWVACVPDVEDMPLVDLLPFVLLGAENGEWSFAVEDEVKPYVPLDGVDDDGAEDDPVLARLQADPAVGFADHPDREWFTWRPTAPMTLDEAAALVVRSLTAGHVAGISAGGTPPPSGGR